MKLLEKRTDVTMGTLAELSDSIRGSFLLCKMFASSPLYLFVQSFLKTECAKMEQPREQEEDCQILSICRQN